MADDAKQQIRTPVQACGGVISGRVITVLVVSLALALLAGILLLDYVYRYMSPGLAQRPETTSGAPNVGTQAPANKQQ